MRLAEPTSPAQETVYSMIAKRVFQQPARAKMTTPSSLSPCSLSMASCFPALALSRSGPRVAAYATLSSGAVAFFFPTPLHP